MLISMAKKRGKMVEGTAETMPRGGQGEPNSTASRPQASQGSPPPDFGQAARRGFSAWVEPKPQG